MKLSPPMNTRYLPVYLFNVHSLHVAQTGTIQEQHSFLLMHNSYLCIYIKNSTAPQMIFQKTNKNILWSIAWIFFFKNYTIGLHVLIQHGKWLLMPFILMQYEKVLYKLVILYFKHYFHKSSDISTLCFWKRRHDTDSVVIIRYSGHAS